MKIKDLTGFNTKELVEGRHGSFTNYYDSDGNDLRGGNDEANLWYRYDPHEGRLKQNMIAGHQEREARNLGYRDSREAALRVHGIVKSKYHQGKWIQNQGGKWVEVHPFGKPQGVAEAANAAQQAAIAIAKKKKKDIKETATAGATSAANIGTVDAPQLSPGKSRGKRSYLGSPSTGSGKKAPAQPKVVQPKNSDGTAKNGLDMGASLFGQPKESVVIKRR